MAEFLSHHGGVTTTMDYDESEDRLIIKNSGDVSGLIDRNKAIKNDDLGRGHEMQLVASVPIHVLAELQAMWKANDIDPKVGMRAFLNDPDMAAFRTSETKV